MPKNQIKPEAAEPYSEQTSLGGPIPKIGSPGVMPCRMQLSSKILAAAGLKPRDQVELIAEAGEIRIRKIGGPEPSIWSASEPSRPSARKIMLDELRDYRFYAEDMVHPSNQAIQYIWNQFVSCFMTSDTKEIMHQWEEIQKAMNHKPFQPESEAYQKFILQTMLKIEQITKKIPSFDTQNELKALKSKLK